MDANAAERDAINSLIREVMAKPAASSRSGSQPVATPAQSSTPDTRAVAAPQPMQPGRRWTNVRVLMPPPRQAAAVRPFAFEQTSGLRQILELSLSRLLDLSRFFDVSGIFRAPGPAMTARLWVALGVAYSASLTFWPYPKTYLWGLVLYLMCLGLALVTSLWGARLSWDARVGGAHTVALVTALWAFTLGTALALPLAS